MGAEVRLGYPYEQRLAPKPDREIEGTRGSGLDGKNGVRQGGSSLVKSWKTLFSLPAKTSGPLQFSKPCRIDGKLVVKPPAEAVEEGIDMWRGCLVGQFLDKRLPFQPLTVLKLSITTGH